MKLRDYITFCFKYFFENWYLKYKQNERKLDQVAWSGYYNKINNCCVDTADDLLTRF